MKNKLSKNIVDNYNPEKITRYSIRKASFGVTSVAVAAFFMYLGHGSAAAADNNIQNQENKISSIDENKNNIAENTVEKTSKETVVKSETNTLDKTKLSSLIAEIESKIVSGAYDSKTEDSVVKLRVELGTVKTILENAKTQEELTRAYNKLVTATTQLKTKPEEKKEAPAVDTTNGKDTVGIKATNTEKSSESNSIANSGSKDERNGKALDKDNSFRADEATTDTDSAANQTYTAPAENADLATLADKLKTLDNYIENNKKVQDMDTLGNALNVEKGSVTEINEFGGWKAVGDSGKFAIARKTEAGVFPIETVNTVWAESSKSYVTWVLEQSFNRDSDYMLFLSKVRTKASSTEEAYDNSTYVSTGLGSKIAKGVKGFDGIQKTFKVYSKEHGSKVIVSFKTGYTGDIDGTKAQYKVEVIINRNGQEEKLYNQTFTPEVSKTNTEMTVVKASDGKNSPQNFSTPGTPLPTKAELEAKMANNKPNGTGGTFKSKEIELPEGVTEYTVRISSADNQRLGMGYQSPYRHYALPVTGLDFNIDQDTGAIAKDLLSRIYDKLKATETADTDGKTNETKAAYLAELEKIKTLVTSTDVKKTAEYKAALESILSKQLALKVDKTGLTDSKTLLDGLVNEDPTPGKTQDTATAYNAAKQEAIKAIEAAKAVIDNESATVAQVREALATVNAKKTALQKAKDGLIVAATAEEKAKLKSDADSLVKADTAGKTPNSIEAYNTKYEAIKAQLEAAKTEAATVLAKENNASKAEAQAAQTKVDAAKAELTKAAELLVNKADKTELIKAKAALNTLATEADPTTGKTADSAKAYNDVKTAAQQAIQEAETVINDENATSEQVSAALEKVNAKKAALQQAKDGLIEAATAEEKAKLKSDTDLLTKADETGKTPDSIAAYERKYEELKAQLEATKAEAAAVLAKGNNATKEEVKAAQEKVDAVKTELENAKNLLVEAATVEEKNKLKSDADSLVKADTTGKTADSIKAYESEFEKLKAQLEAAKTEAAAVLAKGNNATKAEVQAAQAKVDAAKTSLDKAAESLKDLDRDTAKKEIADAAKKATDAIEASTSLTPDQKAEEKAKVAKEAKDAIDAIDKATTEEGINSAKEKGKLAIEKEAAITAIKAEQAAKEQEIDNNSKLSDEEKAAAKAEVAKAAIEAVEAIQKAETQDAVDAAQAKGEKAIKAVNPVGKEKALDAIRKVAEEKITEIDKNDKLSAEEKAAAKAEVAKAVIEAVEAIQKAETQDAVDAAQAKGEKAIKAVNPIGKALNGQPINKDALTKAATTEAEATKGSPAYYNEEEAKKAAYDKALEEAKKVLAKANATQAEVDAALKALEEAKAALNGQPTNKDALTKAATTEAEATKGSPAYYNAEEAKKAAYDEALAEAKKVLENDKATQAEVDASLKALEEAKAALNGQPTNKDALTKAATTEAEATKGSPAYYNAEEAKKAAYDEALAEAKKVLENDKATQAEVDAALKALEEAKAALNGLETHKIDPAINEVEEFDLSKLLVKGIVVVKKGQDLTEKDIRSKLNLPDGVDIVEIEYPNTNTLGKKVAKVIFRGNDGNLFTIEVPVEVVENTTNTDETNNNRYSEGRILVNKNTEQTNKEGLKASKNTLPNTGTTETNTGLAGLGLGILGALLAATRRRKEK